MSEGTHQKSEHCGKCNQDLEVVGSRRAVEDACEQFRKEHSHYTVAWACYQHDMGVKIDAVYDNELDALRHAVGAGYLKVAALEAGEIGNLP